MYKRLLPDHCLLPGALGPVKQTVEVSYWMTSSADAGTTLLVGRYSYWRSSTISSAQNRSWTKIITKRALSWLRYHLTVRVSDCYLTFSARWCWIFERSYYTLCDVSINLCRFTLLLDQWMPRNRCVPRGVQTFWRTEYSSLEFQSQRWPLYCDKCYPYTLLICNRQYTALI